MYHYLDPHAPHAVGHIAISIVLVITIIIAIAITEHQCYVSLPGPPCPDDDHRCFQFIIHDQEARMWQQCTATVIDGNMGKLVYF